MMIIGDYNPLNRVLASSMSLRHPSLSMEDLPQFFTPTTFRSLLTLSIHLALGLCIPLVHGGLYSIIILLEVYSLPFLLHALPT
jgi:hypothetical protein